MQIIERLKWDSNFFGYEIGKINYQSFDNNSIKEILEKSTDYKLVYVFVNEKINHPKFKLVDEKVTLSINVFNSKIQDSNITSFDKLTHDFDELKKLAIISGIYSRFKIDQNFSNNEFERLYTEWINQTVTSENTLDILVYLFEDKIVGFVTLLKVNEKKADIGLLAVNESFRGKGIGSKLLIQAINLCFENGYDELNVVTQQQNLPALNLYQSNKFIISEKKNIYHIWNL